MTYPIRQRSPPALSQVPAGVTYSTAHCLTLSLQDPPSWDHFPNKRLVPGVTSWRNESKTVRDLEELTVEICSS